MKMSKEIVYDGKSYTIKVTERELNDVRRDAEIFKLNGHDYYYFLKNMRHPWVGEDFPELVKEVFNDVNPKLEVGMGATLNLFSDRRAMTIVEVISPKEIVVMENETNCLDYYSSKYEILDSIAEYMGKHTFTLRKNGMWIEKGQPKKHGSVTLSVGFRRHYIDPSL